MLQSTSVGFVLSISAVAALLYGKASSKLGGFSITKRILVILIGVFFMFVSLLNAQHVLEIDYAAVNYGFPLPWLVHYIAGITAINVWFPNVIGVVGDYLFWLVVSFVIVLSFQTARRTK